MRHACLLVLALLTACENRPRMHTDADIEAMAHDAANDALRPKIAELEGRIDELHLQVRELETRADEARRINNNNARLMDDRWDIYQNHTHGPRY